MKKVHFLTKPFLGYYFILNNLFRAFFLFYVKNCGENSLSSLSIGNITWERGWKNKDTWLNIKRIKFKIQGIWRILPIFADLFYQKIENSYCWESHGSASLAFFRFFNHKFKKVASANNMFVRPVFSRKLPSDWLQCFIKVVLKIIAVGMWNSSWNSSLKLK